MINFDDELKKFKPSLETGDIDNAVAQSDLRDVADILEDLIKTMGKGTLPDRGGHLR